VGRSGAWRALLAGALIVVVAGIALIAWATLADKKPGPSHPKVWDARVEPIARFVEKERDLRFDHPVRVDFLAVAAFKKKIGEGKPPTKQEKLDVANQVAELRAVGLVSGDIDLAALEKKLVTESVIGYYDPDAKQVFVRGDQITPDVRVTLAHELSHALQDQRFDLRRFREDNTGRASAYRALYEADAVRIEDAYQKNQLNAAETQEFEKARASDRAEADLSSIPDVLGDSFSFPYVFGPYFTKALINAGGSARVDQAFARPPTSDAEIVSPELYLDGFVPETVDAPALASGEKRVDKPATIGQVGLLQVLGARLGYVKAWNAVRGWKGDTSVDYRKAGRVCVAIAAVFTSDLERDRFDAGSREWAKSMPAASTTRDGNKVLLRSCDPGPTFKAPTAKPSPFQTLQTRDAFAEGVAQSAKLERRAASCVSDRLILQLGPEAFDQLNQDQPAPQVLTALQAAAPVAGARCRANADDRL
jgi:hypothetical protein